MADDNIERPVGALPGPNRGVAPTVSVEGRVEHGFRPGQGASNPDWNSGENNLGMYRDPAEVAWERQERARQMENEQAPNPNPAEGAENGTAAVQQPKMPKRGRGRPKKSVSNESSGAAGNDHVRVSDVPRRRDPDPAKLPAVRQPRADQGRKTPAISRDLKGDDADAAALEADRNKAMLGFMTFERYIQEAPLKDAFILFNDFSKRIIDAGNAIESRRLAEKQSENACSFCDHVFTFRGTDIYKARRAFDLPDGRVQVVMACSRSKCLDEFDNYVQDMSMRSRETLH